MPNYDYQCGVNNLYKNKNKNKKCISSAFKMTIMHIILYITDTVVIIHNVMVNK